VLHVGSFVPTPTVSLSSSSSHFSKRLKVISEAASPSNNMFIYPFDLSILKNLACDFSNKVIRKGWCKDLKDINLYRTLVLPQPPFALYWSTVHQKQPRPTLLNAPNQHLKLAGMKAKKAHSHIPRRKIRMDRPSPSRALLPSWTGRGGPHAGRAVRISEKTGEISRVFL